MVETLPMRSLQRGNPLDRGWANPFEHVSTIVQKRVWMRAANRVWMCPTTKPWNITLNCQGFQLVPLTCNLRHPHSTGLGQEKKKKKNMVPQKTEVHTGELAHLRAWHKRQPRTRQRHRQRRPRQRPVRRVSGAAPPVERARRGNSQSGRRPKGKTRRESMPKPSAEAGLQSWQKQGKRSEHERRKSNSKKNQRTSKKQARNKQKEEHKKHTTQKQNKKQRQKTKQPMSLIEVKELEPFCANRTCFAKPSSSDHTHTHTHYIASPISSGPATCQYFPTAGLLPTSLRPFRFANLESAINLSAFFDEGQP